MVKEWEKAKGRCGGGTDRENKGREETVKVGVEWGGVSVRGDK